MCSLCKEGIHQVMIITREREERASCTKCFGDAVRTETWLRKEGYFDDYVLGRWGETGILYWAPLPYLLERKPHDSVRLCWRRVIHRGKVLYS